MSADAPSPAAPLDPTLYAHIAAYGDAAFQCGEWRPGDAENYEQLVSTFDDAFEALLAALLAAARRGGEDTAHRRGTVTLSGNEMRALRWAAGRATWVDDRMLLDGILRRACSSRAAWSAALGTPPTPNSVPVGSSLGVAAAPAVGATRETVG